jgi:hypothetical protein
MSYYSQQTSERALNAIINAGKIDPVVLNNERYQNLDWSQKLNTLIKDRLVDELQLTTLFAKAVSLPRIFPEEETVDEAAVAANKAFNGNYKRQLLGLWEQYSKADPAATSVVTFQFQINTNGTVDPKANVKITCKPDPTRTVPPNPPTTFSAEFKKLMMTWKFTPASEPFIYEHPSSLKFGS